MSLSKRLKQLEPKRRPDECVTCLWLRRQPAGDQAAFWDWVDRGNSPAQLRKECEGLEASESAFNRHVKNHRSRWLNPPKLKPVAS